MPPRTPSTPVRPTDFRQPGSAPRWRIGVGAAVVAVLVLLAVGVALSAFAAARGATDSVGAPTGQASSSRETIRSSGSPSAAGGVFVHILGRVARPGLYEVGPEARAIDVVSAAGGFADDADQASLNLARRVSDGEQIVIPRMGEAPVVVPGVDPSVAAGGNAQSGGGATVDLNTADSTLLESLPGVGPSTAQAILDWRAENGRFESVDDLLDVTGIGAKKLEKLRDRVRVG